ncbi:MAG: hypothetical protein PHF50_01500 [Patescibacteria group bacterium]|nr:hypothetical protein [Patescibacteria group bacterium]
MLEKKSVFLQVVYSFIAAVISSFIFSSLFKLFYDKILNPSNGGYGLFYGRGEELIVGAIIFAYLFFLPLFIMVFVSRKQWLSWLILIFVPFTMVLAEGSKHILWFFIFTLAGGLIGWLINLVIKKFKK